MDCSFNESLIPGRLKRILEPVGRDSKRLALGLQPTETRSLSISARETSREVSRDTSKSPLHGVGNSESPELVCFGSICRVRIQVRHDPLESCPQASDIATSKEHSAVLQLTSRSDACWVSLPEGNLFGCMSAKYSRGFKKLTSISGIEIDAVTPFSALQKARLSWRKDGTSATLNVDMNVYGPEPTAKAVAETLNSVKLFLQPPEYELRSLRYDNPQYLKLPNVSDVDPSHLLDQNLERSPNLLVKLVKEVSFSEVEAILDHLPQPNFLREVFIDARITTSLQRHQKEAVDFIMRRESGDLPPSLSLWKPQSKNGAFFYQNVITGAKSSRIQDSLGGILADDMGLGKTLSILAVIVTSIRHALHFAVSGTRGPSTFWRSLVPSKATLVIVPSAHSWDEEIEKHVHPGTISSHRYHGVGRKIDISTLLSHEIVLTTYATLTAEFCRGQSTLDRVDWYRVVLDEAHVLRNPSTKQFRAIRAIPTRIRWCLTGTPIQNSLEDLGALVKFLRVPILEDTPIFRKHIITPVHLSTSGRFKSLQRLLESLCLRRTKGLLNLPEPVTITNILELSVTEKETYLDFGRSCKRAIDLAVSGHGMKKANQHVIQALLGMRLFCNHGPTGLLGKWYATSLSYSVYYWCRTPAIPEQCVVYNYVQNVPNYGFANYTTTFRHPSGLPSDPDEALSYLQTVGKGAICVLCDCDIHSVQATNPGSGRLTTCNHLICGDCLPEFQADLDDSLKDGRARCSVCGMQGPLDSFIITPSEPPETMAPTPKSYSTKMLALLHNIQNQKSDDKCIIFSFWKKTLDVVAEMFDSCGIHFIRIHGSLPTAKRAEILSQFETSMSTKVLLITFGTGAVGINKLLVANHIHIIEPQWNPSVESQAIGRILRLGQERTVTIVRYIMKGTVEEAVQSRQLRKLQLARGGFGLTKDEQAAQRVHEIMELLCPLEFRS